MANFFRKAKILTVSGGKGGTGKTFLSVNLAVQMAMRLSDNPGKSRSQFSNNRVLLFDADFHLSNAHLLLGVKMTPSLDRYLKKPDALPEYIISTEYGVDLLTFGGDERKVNFIEDSINNTILAELKKLESMYDWIIVDTGAGLTKLIIKQILFADYSLLVTNPEATAIIDCYKLIKFLTMENKDFKNIDICVNRARDFEEGFLCFKKIQSVLQQFNVPAKVYFAGPVLYDKNTFDASLIKGIPAAVMAQGSHFSESYNYIWDYILKKKLAKKMESFFEKIFF